MACFTAKALGLFIPLVLLCALPAHADPFFVRVYGRTYKVDPPFPRATKDAKPQDLMKALPPDLAKGPGFRPSHEEVLAEVEERVWIARRQLEDGPGAAVASREERSAEKEAGTVTGSLPAEARQNRSPELQRLSERYNALDLLGRELRRSLKLPVKTPEEGFSRPSLPPEIEESYRSLNFDPLQAYYGFRRVKAAFRSGDVRLLARLVHYPLTVTGKARWTIRSPDQLVASKDRIMDPHVRDVVARSRFETAFVRDKGMMLGEGEVWITRDRSGFGLGAINLK